MSYAELRESLATAGEDLRTRFLAGESVVDLVHARADLIDAALKEQAKPTLAASRSCVGKFQSMDGPRTRERYQAGENLTTRGGEHRACRAGLPQKP